MAVGDYWPFRFKDTENDMPITINPTNINTSATTANANSAYQQYALQQAQYQQQLQHVQYGQQYAAGNYTVAHPVYITAGTGTYVSTGYGQAIGVGGGLSGPYQVAVYSPYILPPASRRVVLHAFVDANGKQVWLDVDEAFIPILNEINGKHASAKHNLNTSICSMDEGEFSFDEMEEAEKLISEIASENEESQQACG